MQEIAEGVNKMKRLFILVPRSWFVDANPTPLGDKLRKDVRKWLSPPDPSINHNIACEAHHRGTATWFTHGAAYENWKARGSLLWIHGKRMFLYSPSNRCR